MPTNKVSPSLQGCRVALTSAPDSPNSLADQLREREAALYFYPGIQTLSPNGYDELDAALQRCQKNEISWLLLTTPCAVEAVAERLPQLGISNLAETRMAFYGAMTRIRAAKLFPSVSSTLPHADNHQQLVDAMQLSADDAVLVPLAQNIRADWSTLLRATGAETIAVPAYRLILGRSGDDLPGLLWNGFIDAIVFFTENSVRHFAIRLKAEGGSLDMLKDVVVACLDPQTATAAQVYGLHVQVLPTEDSLAALAESLARFFSAEATRV
jgi:uroporphyrinogen III methyltransferase/synthase